VRKLVEIFEDFFDSKTIKPSFKYVHLILSLFIFDAYSEGLGRYKLEDELLITSGMAKSIFKKLKEKGIIELIGPRKGHKLSQYGKSTLENVKKLISITIGNKDFLDIALGNSFYLARVANALDKFSNGIAQRDAAVKIKDLVDNIKIDIKGNDVLLKIKNIGATCLIYDNKQIKFPEPHSTLKKEGESYISERIIKFLEKNLKLENKDVIIIGGAEANLKDISDNAILNETEEKIARLAALNSALSFFNKD